MRRLIKYTYKTWVDTGECYSWPSSQYALWENGILVAEDVDCELFSDDHELRESFKYLEPFDIHSDTEYF